MRRCARDRTTIQNGVGAANGKQAAVPHPARTSLSSLYRYVYYKNCKRYHIDCKVHAAILDTTNHSLM